MPEVTGYTAAKVDALIAGSVVGGSIDSGTGDLNLTTVDGSVVALGSVTAGIVAATTATAGIVELATDSDTTTGTDSSKAITPLSLSARSATSSRTGLVELATNAETLTGTDAVRAVTPAGLASIPGVKIIADPSETATTAGYPVGMSLVLLSASAWSLNSGSGVVVTANDNGTLLQQTFYSDAGGTGYPRTWVREYHPTNGGGGWTAWVEHSLLATLAAASYTQLTALSSYPQGFSRIYYTTATSSSWDFTGKDGEVLTYRDGANFARQTFTRHIGGSNTYTEVWVRTATNAGGWGKWCILFSDTGWTNLTYNTGYTAGTAQQLQYRVRDNVVYFRGGATGTFTSSTYQQVTAANAIPSAYRPTQTHLAGAMGTNLLGCGSQITTTGEIMLGFVGSSVPSWISFSTSYPI